MNFISIEFLFFIIIVLSIYWLANDKLKKYILIFASLLFCYTYGLEKLEYLLIYVFASFVLGKYINKNFYSLSFSIILCLFPLVLAKYFDFSILGISFISFRAISFIVDKYNGKIDEIDVFDYILYLLFFPTFLSGPIEKSKTFIKQINTKKQITWNKFVEAVIIITYGILLKIVIADNLILVINEIYNYLGFYRIYSLIAVVLYSIYIYCDFYGYSRIAYGLGMLFGYNLNINFKQPYLSTSIKEFWNTWHTSLGEWLNEYIYIPLGGNRKGLLRKYINILVVFIASGIWHGNTLNFVLWGLINGLIRVIEEIVDNRYRTNNKILKTLRIIVTDTLICLTWTFFALDFNGVIKLFSSLLLPSTLNIERIFKTIMLSVSLDTIEIVLIIVSMLIMIIVDILSKNNICVSNIISNSNIVIRYVALLAMIIVIIVAGRYGLEYNSASFIYMGF